MGKRMTKCYQGSANLNLIHNRIDSVVLRMKTKSIEELCTLEWRGRKQNIIHFIINGFCFCSSFNGRFRDLIYTLVCSKRDLMEPFTLDLVESVPYIDLDLHKCVIPSFTDYHLKDLVLWCMARYPYDTLEIIYNGAMSDLMEYMSRGYADVHYNFNYRDICNTQAFSYYLTLIWAMNLSKDVKCLFGKDYTRLRLANVLDSLCPEGCIHDRYFKGEIDSKELRHLYTDKSKGVSIASKELLSISTEGAYDGDEVSNVELNLTEDLYGFMYHDIEFNVNRGVGFVLLARGTYTNLFKEAEAAKEQAKLASEDVEKYKQRTDLARGNVSKLKAEISSLETELIDVKKQLSEVKIESELISEIEELRKQISELTIENNKLFNERADLKQSYSKQKKEIKKLHARLDELGDVEDEVCTSVDDTVDFNFEETVEKLKGLKILAVGMEFNSSIFNSLEELGISVKQFDKGTKSIGKYDLGVIFTSRCGHSDVFKLESLARGTNLQIVYYNGSNINQLIERIADVILE